MFGNQSPLLNAAVFAGCAVLVWLAGARLARYADAIAEYTGIGREVLGVLLLGGVTSLPELTVAATATWHGKPALSVNDVLGSAALNVVFLAVADAAYGRRALTSTPGTPGVLIQGVLGIVLLSLVAAPVIVGDRLLFGAGAWSWAMLAVYALAVWLIVRSRQLRSWLPQGKPAPRPGSQEGAVQASLRSLVVRTAAAGAVILVAAFVLTRAAEALAEQTGLGTNFFGVVFLAFATSLPEVSTVLAAVRLRRYEMAIADVFGTNLFNVTIIVLVDVMHPGGPVLVEAGRFAAFGALLAIVLTALYVIGMLERRDRTVLRMGLDSLVVVLVYVGGLAVLYRLR